MASPSWDSRLLNKKKPQLRKYSKSFWELNATHDKCSYLDASVCLYKPSLTHTYVLTRPETDNIPAVPHICHQAANQTGRRHISVFFGLFSRWKHIKNENDYWENQSILSGWMDGVNLWWCFSKLRHRTVRSVPRSAPYLAERSKNLPSATYWCFAIVLRALRVECWNAFTLLGSTCGILSSDGAFFQTIERHSSSVFQATAWQAPKTILIAGMYPFFPARLSPDGFIP